MFCLRASVRRFVAWQYVPVPLVKRPTSPARRVVAAELAAAASEASRPPRRRPRNQHVRHISSRCVYTLLRRTPCAASRLAACGRGSSSGSCERHARGSCFQVPRCEHRVQRATRRRLESPLRQCLLACGGDVGPTADRPGERRRQGMDTRGGDAAASARQRDATAATTRTPTRTG